jgi:hypothetical protein
VQAQKSATTGVVRADNLSRPSPRKDQPQRVLAEDSGKYQVKELVENVRDYRPVLRRVDAYARVLKGVLVPRQVLDVAEAHLHQKIALLSGALSGSPGLAHHGRLPVVARRQFRVDLNLATAAKSEFLFLGALQLEVRSNFACILGKFRMKFDNFVARFINTKALGAGLGHLYRVGAALHRL